MVMILLSIFLLDKMVKLVSKPRHPARSITSFCILIMNNFCER